MPLRGTDRKAPDQSEREIGTAANNTEQDRASADDAWRAAPNGPLRELLSATTERIDILDTEPRRDAPSGR